MHILSSPQIANNLHHPFKSLIPIRHPALGTCPHYCLGFRPTRFSYTHFSSSSAMSQAFVAPLSTPRKLRIRTNKSGRCHLRSLQVVMSASGDRKGILMLCLGNICRSPAAEAVMNGVLQRRQLTDRFFVDSCGTGGGSTNWYMEGGFSYHYGDPADPRMRAAAKKRGLRLDSRSRPLTKEDFHNFHIIVGMDSSNLEFIETARAYWAVQKATAQVALMSQFSPDENFRGRAVPDPYYSGADGFEYALDLIQGACDGLADYLTNSIEESS